jgi:general secretion pathway protein L
LEGLVSADNISAEPALVELAGQILQQPVKPLSKAERMIQTIHSSWDLSKRLQMRNLANRGPLEWLKAPRWRSARWAALTLVGVNLLGLNALAWLDEHQLSAKRQAMQKIGVSTFPNMNAILDAPVQMKREVSFLEHAQAAPVANDLDVMLGALSQTMPAGQTLKGVDYTNGQLRVMGLDLNTSEASALSIGLKAHGYSATRDGVNWLMQPAVESTEKL